MVELPHRAAATSVLATLRGRDNSPRDRDRDRDRDRHLDRHGPTTGVVTTASVMHRPITRGENATYPRRGLRSGNVQRGA